MLLRNRLIHTIWFAETFRRPFAKKDNFGVFFFKKNYHTGHQITTTQDTREKTTTQDTRNQRIYPLKVGLGISQTNADSQWNPV